MQKKFGAIWKKLKVEFVAYVDKSLSVNDYTNPFTDEKYRESLRKLINDTREGAIIVMDGEYFEMMERSSFRVPSIVLFDYEHKDTKDAKFIDSYSQLCDFLRGRNEKVFVIGGYDAWSSLVQCVSKVHFIVTDEKWGEDMTRPFIEDVHKVCKMTSYSEFPNEIIHQEREFADNVMICNSYVSKDKGCELYCWDVLSHVNSEGEPVCRVLSNGLSTIIEGGDTFSIVTDFKMYRIPSNTDIRVVENPRFRSLGIVMQSCKISDGEIILSFVNNSPHSVVLDYKKVVANLHIIGDYKLIGCNNDFSESTEMGKWGTELIKH